MIDTGQTRDRAYLDLLHYGLVLLRNVAQADRAELCKIEAEHLHEVPTLIGERNELRDLHYINETRNFYLSSLRVAGETEYLMQVTIWYTGPWKVLATIANVALIDA